MSCSVHVLECQGDRLIAIEHRPTERKPQVVLTVVGGPQYRVGSHRMFVDISERLAAANYASVRFDCRGMGDSEGASPGFENLGDDIASAIDFCYSQGMSDIVLFGLCDGASAAMMYAHRDPRVKGMVLLNPWAHTEEVAAEARLRSYYLKRVLQLETWKNALGGNINPISALKEIGKTMASKFGKQLASNTEQDGNFVNLMRLGLADFNGPVLIALSEHDQTAREFELTCSSSDQWQQALDQDNKQTFQIDGADHTLSAPESMASFTDSFLSWLNCFD